MKPEKARELVVVLIHLTLWSELGVLTRIYLDLFFSGACSGSFGVCLTSDGVRHRTLGAYFPDLPSNLLGSFLMGLLAASGTLGIPNGKQLAILPESSSWQAAPELHIGLRTGYCGSLTTFASWEYSLVTGLIGGQGKQGGQWAEFLWGLVIVLQLSLSSYVFGQHCALTIDRYLVHGGMAEADLERELQQRALDIADVRGGRLSEAARALERDESIEGRTSGEDRLGDDTWLQRHSQKEDEGRNHENGHVRPSRLNVEESSSDTHRRAGRSGLQSVPGRLRTSWMKEFLWQDSGKFPFHRRTNLAAITLTGLVTALFIVLTILDGEARHLGRRQQWLAILLGPFGCILRWLLSKTNYKLPGSWNWLPIGTFAANMLACTIDYFVGGAISQVGSIGYWGTMVTYAIRTGFCGALSTVSTFVAEVQVQLKMVPEKLRGYVYSVGSLLIGSLLGVIIYGPMYWTS